MLPGLCDIGRASGMNSKQIGAVILCTIIYGLAIGWAQDLPELWQRVLVSGLGGAALGVGLVVIVRRGRNGA